MSNLHLILAGTKAPNPGELLESSRLEKLLSLLAEKYDHIVIDSAPILAVADSRLIAPLVDNFCFVLRADQTPKGAVRARPRTHLVRRQITLRNCLQRFPRKAPHDRQKLQLRLLPRRDLRNLRQSLRLRKVNSRRPTKQKRQIGLQQAPKNPSDPKINQSNPIKPNLAKSNPPTSPNLLFSPKTRSPLVHNFASFAAICLPTQSGGAKNPNLFLQPQKLCVRVLCDLCVEKIQPRPPVLSKPPVQLKPYHLSPLKTLRPLCGLCVPRKKNPTSSSISFFL